MTATRRRPPGVDRTVAVEAAPRIDTNTLVVFKDGFDTPYGDGTQNLPPDGA